MPSEVSPVLLIGFNRPELLAAQLETLARHGVTRLYISLDGPRKDRPIEATESAKTKRLAEEFKKIPSVMILSQETNLGCRRAVTTAISWFFQNEESGIILEDDCIVDHSFLDFCTRALESLRNIKEIGHISGSNFFPIGRAGNSVVLSNFAPNWGWATWRDRWDNFDSELLYSDPEALTEILRQVDPSWIFRRLWLRYFSEIRSGKIDTWDYLWQVTLWKYGLKAVLPPQNLVWNAGFSKSSTHTVRAPINPSFNPKISVTSPIEVSFKPIGPYKRVEKSTKWLLHYPLGKTFRSLLRLAYIVSRRLARAER